MMVSLEIWENLELLHGGAFQLEEQCSHSEQQWITWLPDKSAALLGPTWVMKE